MEMKQVVNKSQNVGLLVLLLLALAVPGQAQNPVPFISQPLVPAAAAPGGAPFTLTVNGTGFVPGSVVNWNGLPLVTMFVSSDQLKAVVRSEFTASAGTASVTVSNGGVTSNVAYFEVTNPTASVSFLSPLDYAVGGPPLSVAVGDFNGDGKLDLAVANPSSGNVSVLLGYGDGTFQAAVSYPVGGCGPSAIAVGDFNGDGKLDLAVAWDLVYTAAYVTVLLGNGDGTFQTAVSYPVGANPSSVAVGDFNGDGKLDLAVANSNLNGIANESSTSVSVLLGNGDGTFQTAVNYPAGTNPISVAVGDFNGDGKPDLVVANAYGGVTVLLGNGNGTFQTPVSHPVDGNPNSVAVGDFNGDGKLDFAVANNAGSYEVSVLLGNGDGTFQTAVSYPVSAQAYSVAVGDFNGDGKLDLAVAPFSNNVSLLLGNGDGTFQTAVDYPVNGNPSSCALVSAVGVGDFNGDGRMDFAAAVPCSKKVAILLQPPPPAAASGSAQLDGGNTFTGDQTVNGTVTATSFVGNGSGLTGVTATVVNGVYTTGLYSDPAWIASLSGSKIAGPVASALTAGVALTAGALEAAPAQCGTNTFSTGIAANGNANCARPASANLSDGGSLVLNNQANTFMGGKQTLPASAAGYATLNIPNTGAVPNNPAMGDVWLTAADAHLMFQDNTNTTQRLAFLTDVGSSGSSLLGANNTFTGSNTFGRTITGSITGNAGTVTNGVYTTGAYADPSWITFLSGGKITGTVPSAVTATSAGTATQAATAGNASNLGGVAAANYARRDVGNTFTGDQSVAGNVNVNGNSATTGTVTIGGSGTPITAHLSMLVNPNFPALKPSNCASSNFTLTGAADGDTIALGIPNARMTVGGTPIYMAWVSAADTVTIQICNVHLASPQISVGSGSIRVDLWKH
jgi:hypothetical protein